MGLHSYPPTGRGTSMMSKRPGAPVTRPIRADTMAKARRPTLPANAASRSMPATPAAKGPAATTGSVRERRLTLAQSSRPSETLNAPGKARTGHIAPAAAADLKPRRRYRGLGTRSY